MAYDRCNSYKSTPPFLWSQRRQSRNGGYKRGLNSKVHLAVDAFGMPVRFIVTTGTKHDSKVALELIEGIKAEYVLADRGYDSDAIVSYIEDNGMIAVIPPKKNRKNKREYDEYLYKLRHLVENTFLRLKDWRDIATRYAKNTSSFVCAVQIRIISMWLKLY